MTAVTPGRLQQGHRSDSLKSSGTVESGGSGNAGLHTTAPQDGASLDDLVPAALIGARDGLPGLVTWYFFGRRQSIHRWDPCFDPKHWPSRTGPLSRPFEV